MFNVRKLIIVWPVHWDLFVHSWGLVVAEVFPVEIEVPKYMDIEMLEAVAIEGIEYELTYFHPVPYDIVLIVDLHYIVIVNVLSLGLVDEHRGGVME